MQPRPTLRERVKSACSTVEFTTQTRAEPGPSLQFIHTQIPHSNFEFETGAGVFDRSSLGRLCRAVAPPYYSSGEFVAPVSSSLANPVLYVKRTRACWQGAAVAFAINGWALPSGGGSFILRYGDGD